MILELKNKLLNIKNILKLLLTLVISLSFILYALKDFNYNVFIHSMNNVKYIYIYMYLLLH